MYFLNPNNYGKIIRFLKVWVFNIMSTALVCLNVVHDGHTGPTDHSRCSPGQSGHFGWSHAMITQSFENSQKSVFGHTLVLDFGMKEWFARVGQRGARLSDLRAL